jgi:hypothetical protein
MCRTHGLNNFSSFFFMIMRDQWWQLRRHGLIFWRLSWAKRGWLMLPGVALGEFSAGVWFSGTLAVGQGAG